jgi:outer membrane protein insertion porin family
VSRSDQQVLTDQSRGYVDFRVKRRRVPDTNATLTLRLMSKRGSSNLAPSPSEVTGADPLIYEDALRLRTGVTYSPELIERDIVPVWSRPARTDFVRVDPGESPATTAR